MRRTKVDDALAAAEAKHQDDPARVELLRRTRRFKASWIELAEALTDTRRRGDFKRWGYPSFEDYTRLELHLRPETVDKLTGSFLFLQKRAPEVLARDGLSQTIPSYQAVDFLRRAEAEESAPEDTVDALRRRVLDEGAALPAITREFRDQVFPIDEGERKERDVAALMHAAARLRDLLSESRLVPRGLAGELGERLEQLLAALRAKGGRAA